MQFRSNRGVDCIHPRLLIRCNPVSIDQRLQRIASRLQVFARLLCFYLRHLEPAADHIRQALWSFFELLDDLLADFEAATERLQSILAPTFVRIDRTDAME